MPGRVDDNEIDLQVGNVDGVPTVALIAVALTAQDVQPAVEAVVNDGANALVVDISGVGDVDAGVFDYLAKERAYLMGLGGDLAIVGSPSDLKYISSTGYSEAVPAFDGTENAVSYIRSATAAR